MCVILNFAENMTEELLDVHIAEIMQLRDSYEQHKDMYEKLARRQKLWAEYLELEVCNVWALAV